MADVTAHFSRKELRCRCCGRLQVDSRLLDGLEALRRLAGKPILVHAGYRWARHKRGVGGLRTANISKVWPPM